ncbi:M23 family metallopeptidase [Salinibacterium sp.]|uniref:M23 family metallopeptidase n=1 Tax=Salinibacterium sp. TaxID=1915057 RepID=UPI00286B0D0D|nr:M23 family metallopeptidase [Salinibacterium sp.]
MLRAIALVLVLLVAPGSAAAEPPSSLAADTGDARWGWPVAAPHVVVRQFIAPANRYASGHRGVDLAAHDGAVYAPADGIVHFAGVVVDRPVLSIRHPGGLISSFEPVETTLTAGDPVARGDPVGTAIQGHCSALCVHFGVRLDGEYVSPMLYLGGLEPSVLLPTRR